MTGLQIVEVTEKHLGHLAPLFDAYRVFYKQKSNLAAAKQFLNERITKSESTIFLAYNQEGIAVGFVQLYPTFSSVSLQNFYILNDLYVKESERSKGIGKALLLKSIEFAHYKKSKGLALETVKDNPAQKLYEHLGWKKDTEFLHYFRGTKEK